MIDIDGYRIPKDFIDEIKAVKYILRYHVMAPMLSKFKSIYSKNKNNKDDLEDRCENE